MTINFKVFGDYGDGLPQAIEHATSRDSSSYANRKKLAFKSFSSFIASNYGLASPDNIGYICMHFRSHVYSNRGEKSIISANSDYLAWANLMKDLIRLRFIPRCTVPKGLKSSHPVLRISDKMNCLGSMNPKLWKREFHEASFTELQAIADQDYLTLFYEHQLEYRDKLVRVARSYIREAAERFNKGKQYIQSSVPEDFAHPKLLHPTIKNKKSSSMSLFSNQLPNNEGVKNLVGYLFHKHQGLIVHSFPGANNHLYRFGGRTMLQEHLGLSSEIAAACAIIITQETGMNPESLYNLKLNNAKNIISPHESLDGYYLNYQKPRAGGEISRLIKRNKESINTEFCIRLVIELTEHHRSLANPETADHLFIHDTVKEHKSITPVSVFAFKAALKRLIEKSFDIELISTQVTLSKLRVSGGIIAWLESGGDPRAAARYLGNSIGVALKNYIPRELQEFFYRKQIRQFQHLLIAVATDNKPYQNIALEIKSSDTLNKYLENNVSNSKLLKSIQSENQNCATKVTFFISENNIALLQTVKNEFIKSNKKRKHHFKKWHDVATILFAYIRHQGTRRQQQIMKNGIDLSLNDPIILEDE